MYEPVLDGSVLTSEDPPETATKAESSVPDVRAPTKKVADASGLSAFRDVMDLARARPFFSTRPCKWTVCYKECQGPVKVLVSPHETPRWSLQYRL